MKKNGFFIIGICLSMHSFAGDAPKGKQLFTSNCASCHAIGKEVIGPALLDVDNRRSEAWIISFVHSSQKVIQSGDTAGVRLFETHNHTIMPDHPGLSEDDIKNIIAFIKEEGARVKSQPAMAISNDDPKPYLGKSSFLHQLIFLDTDSAQQPLSFNNVGLWVMILMSIGILLLVLYLAVSVEGWKVKGDHKKTKE
jgi:cytochrome c2